MEITGTYGNKNKCPENKFFPETQFNPVELINDIYPEAWRRQ